jgi:hypothetical protein
MGEGLEQFRIRIYEFEKKKNHPNLVGWIFKMTKFAITTAISSFAFL